jgi:hypothetical protein
MKRVRTGGARCRRKIETRRTGDGPDPIPSGIDDGDGLDLDHEIGAGETGDTDGRAGRDWGVERLKRCRFCERNGQGKQRRKRYAKVG